MPDILDINKNSAENLQAFIDTIEDIEIRDIVRNHIDDVLFVGASSDDQADQCKESFYTAIEQLIEARLANIQQPPEDEGGEG